MRLSSFAYRFAVLTAKRMLTFFRSIPLVMVLLWLSGVPGFLQNINRTIAENKFSA